MKYGKVGSESAMPTLPDFYSTRSLAQDFACGSSEDCGNFPSQGFLRRLGLGLRVC